MKKVTESRDPQKGKYEEGKPSEVTNIHIIHENYLDKHKNITRRGEVGRTSIPMHDYMFRNMN